MIEPGFLSRLFYKGAGPASSYAWRMDTPGDQIKLNKILASWEIPKNGSSISQID